VDDAHAGSHPLYVAALEVARIAATVAMAQAAPVEERDGLEPPVRVRPKVEGVRARLGMNGAKVVQKDKGVYLVEPLGGQGLTNAHGAHRKGVAGSYGFNTAIFHACVPVD
jgi:hypothetical protein